MMNKYRDLIENWGDYLFGSDRMVQSILLGGFLLSLQTIVTHIFVTGFVVRFLTESKKRNTFEFDDWKSLFKFGVVGYIIWIGYFLPSLILWILWIEYYYPATQDLTKPDYAQELANATSEIIGMGLGMPWGAVNDLIRIIQDIGVHIGAFDLLNTSQDPTFKAQILFYLFIVSFLFALFVFPAALYQYSQTKNLRSSFSIKEIYSLSTTRRYFQTWIVLVIIWGIMFIIQHLWNGWRVDIPTDDKTLVSVGIIPVIEAPTFIGIISTSTLLITSFASFLLLFFAFYILKENMVMD